MNLVLYYTTFSKRQEALKISRILLDEKLIACANILGTCDSMYFWGGKLCRDKEVPVFFKTTQKLAAKFKKRFFVLHPYEVPSLVKIKSNQENPEYLKWMGKIS